MAKKDIDTLKHKDKRTNIPTEELRDFVAEEERAPKKILYPRDPSLDPQLVWQGKDEQDAKPLEVPAVPIYIQEKIHPQAIIEDLRAQKDGSREKQIAMFAEFNGLPDEFEKRVDFYHWDQNWSNRMILGDSLMVMTSLAEKEGLKGKVQMIFIDPPYGIEFGSNWQVSTRKRVVRDGRADDLTRQPEQIRAFRDAWSLGIHSYLAYLRDRLATAQELLTESGSIFVQIGDENLHLVRGILDEIFGSENVHPVIMFRKKMMPLMKEGGFESMCDFILWYQKNKQESARHLAKLFEYKNTEGDSAWNWAELPDNSRRKLTSAEIGNNRLLAKGSKVFQPISLLPREYRQNQDFPFTFEGEKLPPPNNICWSTTLEGMKRLAYARRLQRSGDEGLRYAYFHADYPVARLTSSWMDAAPATHMRYVVETNPEMIQRLMLVCTQPGDIVLDPTCGSGTTAVVAEQWGRRWITIDTSRVALALARARLMAERFSYYLLADSVEGLRKEAEVRGILNVGQQKTDNDVKKGFVYTRVPHVTLGDIANNEEIDEIHPRYQQQLEPLRAELNKLLKQKWEEW